MSVAKKTKTKLIKEFATTEKDTGSPEVQIALLTENIAELAKHMETHAKDFHSRRGLTNMVANRARLLKYLQKTDTERYAALIKKLGLRK